MHSFVMNISFRLASEHLLWRVEIDVCAAVSVSASAEIQFDTEMNFNGSVSVLIEMWGLSQFEQQYTHIVIIPLLYDTRVQ